MKLKDVIEKLEKNSEFNEWRKSNKDWNLAHAFMMMDNANANIWQIGYYNKESDKVTTFIIERDDIKIAPEQNIFKKPDAAVLNLDIEKVKIGSVQAIETAEGVMEKEYPQAVPMKMFFIIQNLHELGHIYNVTFVTMDFRTINIRISSENGDVLSHKVENIIEFKK